MRLLVSRKGAKEEMQITDVRVRKVEKEGKLKAVVSITMDDEFVVHDIKVIEGEKGLFIAMSDASNPWPSFPEDKLRNSYSLNLGGGNYINIDAVGNSVVFSGCCNYDEPEGSSVLLFSTWDNLYDVQEYVQGERFELRIRVDTEKLTEFLKGAQNSICPILAGVVTDFTPGEGYSQSSQFQLGINISLALDRYGNLALAEF